MSIDHYRNITMGSDTRRIKFIGNCLLLGIPLSNIETNDWMCNTKPSVYIKNKNNQFKMKRYFRCANSDAYKAQDFYLAQI